MWKEIFTQTFQVRIYKKHQKHIIRVKIEKRFPLKKMKSFNNNKMIIDYTRKKNKAIEISASTHFRNIFSRRKTTKQTTMLNIIMFQLFKYFYFSLKKEKQKKPKIYIISIIIDLIQTLSNQIITFILFVLHFVCKL